MTREQIDLMTQTERSNYSKKIWNMTKDNVSFEDYLVYVRDYIYLWRHYLENRKLYTFDYVSNKISSKKNYILREYNHGETVDDTATEVEYSCG